MNNSQENGQSKLSIHTGNGNLQGGGVRQNGSSKIFLKLRYKLEGRIGPILLLCFLTVAIMLTINGVFYASLKSTVLQMIEGMEREIILSQQHELAQMAGIETTTIKMEEEEGGNNETTILVDGGEGGIEAVRTLLQRRAEQLAELNGFRQRVNETDWTIWLLVIFAILGTLLMSIGIFMRGNREEGNSQNWRMAYKALLLFAICLLLIQLFLLLFSLLPFSISLPSIIDRLFFDYLANLSTERRQTILEPIEDGFACKMKVDHALLETLGFQKPCIPKIKDRLLAPCIVLILILIVIFPFIFAIFTFIWAIRLKEYGPIRKARKRVELNQGEKRPQSREEILTRALGTNSTTTAKIYY